MPTNGIDLSRFSDTELESLATGDLSGLSDANLEYLGGMGKSQTHPFSMIDRAVSMTPIGMGVNAVKNTPKELYEGIGATAGSFVPNPGGPILGAAAGGALGKGAEMFRRKIEGEDISLRQAASAVGGAGLRGAVGGALFKGGTKVLGAVAKPLSRAKDFLRPETQARMTNVVRKGFFRAKGLAGQQFENEFKAMKGTFDFSEEMAHVNSVYQTNPTAAAKIDSAIKTLNQADQDFVRSAIQGSRIAESGMREAGRFNSLTPSQAQRIKETLGRAMKSKWDKSFGWDPADVELADAFHTFRAGIVKHVPGAEQTYEKYAETLGDLRMFKSNLPKGKLDDALARGFGPEKKVAMKKLLKPSVQKIAKSYQRGRQALKWAPAAAAATAAGAVGLYRSGAGRATQEILR